MSAPDRCQALIPGAHSAVGGAVHPARVPLAACAARPPRGTMARRWTRASLALLALVLAGCASLDPDAGLRPVAAAVEARAGVAPSLQRSQADLDAARERSAALLAEPLGMDAAVQLALLNHRGLQARLHDLGIADAELAQLGTLPNPGFSFGRSRSGDEREIERALHFNLAALLLRPLARNAEARRLEALQRQVTVDVLAHIADVRRAWVQAVAAEQELTYARQVMDAADAGAELARRMVEAGNWTRLRQMREHGFFAEAALGLARAQQQQVATRERLNRMLGLWGEQTLYTLPERLPDLPPEPPDRPDIEREALATRLDLAGAQALVEATARNLGLTRATRFVSVFEYEIKRSSNNQGERSRGWEIGFEIPLFDWGTARTAKAEHLYMQAVHRAADVAVQARSEVREAWHAQRTAWDIARHYRDEIVPAAQRIGEENVLLYNGMFVSVFELLADARAQVGAVSASIAALRDFWLAQADLEMALVGRPALDLPMPGGGAGGTAAPAADPH
jgi:outer membrane protein TolC